MKLFTHHLKCVFYPRYKNLLHVNQHLIANVHFMSEMRLTIHEFGISTNRISLVKRQAYLYTVQIHCVPVCQFVYKHNVKIML